MQIKDLMGEAARRRDAESPYVVVRRPGGPASAKARIPADSVETFDDFVAKIREKIGAGLVELEFYGPADPCDVGSCSDPSPYAHVFPCLKTVRITIPAIPGAAILDTEAAPATE